jgi:serine/threonine protein kinase
MDKTPTLRIGEKLGRFDITDILPAGGMGEVYRAKDPTLQRDVAIKLLLRSEPHDLERFMREAQTAAGFSHPNIVSIFELGTEQRGDHTFPYLVMEFIEGESLRERLGASKEQVLRWLSDVAHGLAELHRRGVLHRDLKPANIMIGSDDRARIVDFGLAKTAGTTITTTGTIIGTVDYFSPEQAAGSPLDHRSDIFSFGTVLYEALTGKHPFRRGNVAETVRRIHYESPDRIPGPVGDVVAQCLRKAPKDRYQDAADLARDLRELVQPAPTANAVVTATTADPEATTVRVTPAAPTSPGWHLIALLATLLLASMVVVYKREQPSNPTGPPQADPAPTAAAMQRTTLPPTCGLSGSPGTINYGHTAQLWWSSSNAVDVVISPNIGIVGSDGSINVSPRATTAYEIVATNADGVVAQGAVTIQVTNAPANFVPLSGSLLASPDTIRRGERTFLKWNSFDTTRVVITPTIGIVPLHGSISVAPRTTTTYTMTLTNDAGGFGRGTAIVYVKGADATRVPNQNAGITCVAATQPRLTAAFVSDSSSCSVAAYQSVTQATLNYTLDDAGEISINDRTVFTKALGSGPREGTVTLPIDLFAPGRSFLVRVAARNAVNADGTPAGEVFGRAAVHLAITEPMVGLDIGISPPVIRKGESASLDWSSVDATAVVINPVIGMVTPKGSMTVAPTETTKYTIKGISAGGDDAKASVTLRVQ